MIINLFPCGLYLATNVIFFPISKVDLGIPAYIIRGYISIPLDTKVYIIGIHRYTLDMSQYQKSCSYCKKEIRMSNDTGKWLPLNMDGSFHSCQAQQTGTKKVETSVKPEAKAFVKEVIEGPKLRELDERLKKVEEMLFGKGK